MSDVIRIPSDFQVNDDREIVRHLFAEDVYDYPGQMLNLENVHKKYDGSGINICVLDTGFYPNHPDLDDLVLTESFTDSPNDKLDRNGHSTHIRGIIGMKKNGKGLIGIAPGAKVHVGKVMKNGFGSPEWLADGIDWCIEKGMDIIVGSLGMPNDNYSVRMAVKRAGEAGILMFFASGNEGKNGILYPAALPEGIAIGAVDAAKILAHFSNIGTALDLVAPGVSIKSSWINGNYKEASGTSMATPIAAGVAALYLQKAREKAGYKVEPYKIRNKLYEFSEDLGDAGLDIKYGYGLVSTRYFYSDWIIIDKDPLGPPGRGCLLALLMSAAFWVIPFLILFK